MTSGVLTRRFVDGRSVARGLMTGRPQKLSTVWRAVAAKPSPIFRAPRCFGEFHNGLG